MSGDNLSRLWAFTWCRSFLLFFRTCRRASSSLFLVWWGCLGQLTRTFIVLNGQVKFRHLKLLLYLFHESYKCSVTLVWANNLLAPAFLGLKERFSQNMVSPHTFWKQFCILIKSKVYSLFDSPELLGRYEVSATSFARAVSAVYLFLSVSNLLYIVFCAMHILHYSLHTLDNFNYLIFLTPLIAFNFFDFDVQESGFLYCGLAVFSRPQ